MRGGKKIQVRKSVPSTQKGCCGPEGAVVGQMGLVGRVGRGDSQSEPPGKQSEPLEKENEPPEKQNEPLEKENEPPGKCKV